MEKRLAYLCGSDSRGGLEMNHLRNAKWMQERGHKVLVIGWADTPFARGAQQEGLPFIPLERYRKYYDLDAQRKLLAIILEAKITHLLVRSTYDMSLAAGVKRRLRSNLHLSYFMEMQLGVKKSNPLHTLRFRNFDLWSCPLNYLVEQVRTMTRFPASRIALIPSGIELGKYQSEQTREAAREELQLPTGGLFLGLIGRFDLQKGQKLLLDAFERARKSGMAENVKLCFLGEPTRNESGGDLYFREMESFIRENELSDLVYMRPFMQDPAVFYRAMNWIVMASKAETFGMVTVEAMAAGTPVLGSDRGGTPELLDQGKTGLLFRSQDVADLAQKIGELASEDFHVPDSETLRQHAARFSHDRICQLVEKHLGL